MRFRAAAFSLVLSLAVGGLSRVLAVCGPFTDVAADVFCPFVLEIFYLGITTGTTATTYDPTANVTRLQMAAFLSRTVDGVLRRGSRRAALDQFWTTQNATVLGVTTLGSPGKTLASDGTDIWGASGGSGEVFRVRASDGKLLEAWTGATNPITILVAMGRVFVDSEDSPGKLYRLDPSLPAGAVTTVATNLGNSPRQMAFDGARIWTANTSGSVSIITPGASLPWTVTTVTAAAFSFPTGAVFDGANVWVGDANDGALFRFDPAGTILQTVTLGQPGAEQLVFDGSNIWVPNNSSSSVTVVRASTGTILQTLTGNGLSAPWIAAFDGQRVLVTSLTNSTLSLFKAADLTPISNFSLGGTNPYGACSDGVNFWIARVSPSTLLRF
ncbi:MAG TPA: S-layer homology domain-containing protein [Thermoanaerobaculia bacterium]|nr:S-layer homology domain-containing protein [Thermoanaerobaculia bacterium]